MPVADDIHLVDGRYQRLVDGEYVHPGYKSEDHRRRSQLVGNALLFMVPVAGPIRGLHWGIKGAKWNRAAQQYQSIGRIYGRPGRSFVSRVDFARRPGLPGTARQAARAPHKWYQGVKTKLATKFPRTARTYGRYKFLTDPVETLKKRHIPYYGLVTGAAVIYDRWNTVAGLISSLPGKKDPRPPIGGIRGEPTRRPFPVYTGSGEVIPPMAQPSSPRTSSRTKSQNRRCPPGHRWSSQARKCVPLRRKRS